MGLRPAHCYRGVDKPAYTRLAVTKHDKNFIGTSPHLKTRQFNMGNPTPEYSHIIDLVNASSGHHQLRDNAIEATRMTINRFLGHKLGKEGYFMRIRVYPYHILRENKQAQGAGADRVSQGMSHPFGRPIGRAARVRPNQIIMSLLVNESNLEMAKHALLRAGPKFGFEISLIVHQDTKSLGTRPAKMIEEKVEVKAVAATAEGETATTEAGKEGATTTAGSKTDAKAGAKGTATAGKTDTKSTAGKTDTKTSGKPAGKESAKKK